MWFILFLSLFGQALLFAGLAIREQYLGWALFLIVSGLFIHTYSFLLYQENYDKKRR